MRASERKYYMSVDGGGSKLSVVLFDDTLSIVGRGLSGAINPRFVSERIIRGNFDAGINACLKGAHVTQIEKLYVSMPGPADLFAEMLSQRVKLGQYQVMSEGENGLLGGIFVRRGVVALSGTGSGIFNVNGSESTSIGGWGALFDDEGSGYSIGRDALNAAVKAYEKRGPVTILTEKIVDQWQLIQLSDVINHVYSSDNYRALVASLTELVVEYADEDKICCDILQKAGHEMAQQVIALFARDNIAHDIPIMVAGSVWKNNPSMFRAFYKDVTQAVGGAAIHFPWFEPVTGGAVAYIFERHEAFDDDLFNKLRKTFREFLYRRT